MRQIQPLSIDPRPGLSTQPTSVQLSFCSLPKFPPESSRSLVHAPPLPPLPRIEVRI